MVQNTTFHRIHMMISSTFIIAQNSHRLTVIVNSKYHQHCMNVAVRDTAFLGLLLS